MSITAAHATRLSTFKRLMCEAVAARGDAPLSFSGGIDSTTILFAALENGVTPPCFTFRLGDTDSPDVVIARQIAREFAVPLTVITIPRTPSLLMGDVRRVLALTGSPRRTHVQCAHAYLYLAPAIAAAGHVTCMVGTAADDLYGNTRFVKTACAAVGEHEARLMRKADAEYQGPSSAWANNVIAQAFGVTLDDIYETSALKEYLLLLDMKAIHTPKPKALPVQAFLEHWARGSWYRPGNPFHVVSGLRTFHDTLLTSPFNTRGAKDVTVIYRDTVEAMRKDGRAPASPEPNPVIATLVECERPFGSAEMIDVPWEGDSIDDARVFTYGQRQHADGRRFARVIYTNGRVQWYTVTLA